MDPNKRPPWMSSAMMAPRVLETMQLMRVPLGAVQAQIFDRVGGKLEPPGKDPDWSGRDVPFCQWSMRRLLSAHIVHVESSHPLGETWAYVETKWSVLV